MAYVVIKFIVPMALDIAKEIPAHLPDLGTVAPEQPVEAQPAPAPETEAQPAETTPDAQPAEGGGGEDAADSGGGGGDDKAADSGGGDDKAAEGGDDKKKKSGYGTILDSGYSPLNWN